MFMRSFAPRRGTDGRAMVLMAPGWVRTDLGGPDARLTIEESVPTDRAPVEQYRMGGPSDEIALARSAAPGAIAADASVLVLGKHGYERAVRGGNAAHPVGVGRNE